LQPGLTFVQPRTGFQVASVHSILEFSDKVGLVELAGLYNDRLTRFDAKSRGLS